MITQGRAGFVAKSSRGTLVTMGSIAVLAVACSSASTSNPSTSEMCGAFTVEGSCTIRATTSQTGCPAQPDGAFVINAGAASYTNASGSAICNQVMSACDLTRNCTSSDGTAGNFTIMFTSSGTFTGTVIISPTTGTSCHYDVSGGDCNGTGAAPPEDGGTAKADGGGTVDS